MPDPATAVAATKADGKPKRPVAEIHRDLEKAKAKHKDLHSRVEVDNQRGNAVNERGKRQLEAWTTLHPGEPFDEVIAGFSAEPYRFDEKLQGEFHAVHYEIAALESEMAEAIKARAKV